MSELKVRLYQASLNPSILPGTTKIILLNYFSVPLPSFFYFSFDLYKNLVCADAYELGITFIIAI